MLTLALVLKCIVCCNAIVKGSYIQEKTLDEDFGKNVTLPCHNSKNEVIKWEKQGRVAKQILPNGDLLLDNVQKNDSGLYKCSTAYEDEVLSVIHLNVKTPPAALKNVTVIPATVFALVQWQLDDNGGYPVTNITVRYKKMNSDKWHYLYPISLNRPQADVFRLNPNSSYFFEIWATNKLGRGDVTNVTVKTLHDNREKELARHLLQGAETFDARIWFAAVTIVMTTLLILAISICLVTYRECRISSKGARENTDPERIELIPNVILNPGYNEEMEPSSQIANQNTDEEDDEGDEELTTIYFACRNGAKAIDV